MIDESVWLGSESVEHLCYPFDLLGVHHCLLPLPLLGFDLLYQQLLLVRQLLFLSLMLPIPRLSLLQHLNLIVLESPNMPRALFQHLSQLLYLLA